MREMLKDLGSQGKMVSEEVGDRTKTKQHRDGVGVQSDRQQKNKNRHVDIEGTNQ